MKKFFMIAVVALVFASLTSCKKDYTCTCTGSTMGTITLPLTNATSKDAKDACDASQVTYRNADATVNCEID
ncbi:MAG TPA: hypothetical protein PKN48_08555 [Bacteroidales bacterium]|nr:hypothetical protein [Bacteroidales bacterium]